MKKLIITSMRPNQGKTSVAIGLGKAAGGNISYLKPFGDRIVYFDKNLSDFDAGLMADIFGIDLDPGEMSIGFHHSKLRYLYDENKTSGALEDLMKKAEGADTLIIESGRFVSYGMSVHLDALAVARQTGAEMVMVVGGMIGNILDDILFMKNHINMDGVDFKGVVVNKVQNKDEFLEQHLESAEKMGVKILGVLPYLEELSQVSLAFIAEHVQTRVIAGSENLGRLVKTVLIGAMSLNAVLQTPVFKQGGKLLITSGDRTDMIMAALESDTAGILLSNNILPPPNVLAKAEEYGMPVLLARGDTFTVAKQVDDLESLFTSKETDKVDLLADLVKDNLDLSLLG